VSYLKREARIGLIELKKIKNRILLIIIIYRAGYIDSIEIHKVPKDKNLGNFLKKLLSERHFEQVRFLIIKSSRILKKQEINLGKPFIIFFNKNILKNIDDKIYNILKERNYINDSLNILKIISKIIR